MDAEFVSLKLNQVLWNFASAQFTLFQIFGGPIDFAHPLTYVFHSLPMIKAFVSWLSTWYGIVCECMRFKAIRYVTPDPHYACAYVPTLSVLWSVLKARVGRWDSLYEQQQNLYRAPSTIASGGLGLFTRKSIRRGEVVLWCDCSHDESRKNATLSLECAINDGDMSLDCSIHSNKFERCFERYLNTDKRRNLTLFQLSRTQPIYAFLARRDIESDEELFKRYGARIWFHFATRHMSSDAQLRHNLLQTCNNSFKEVAQRFGIIDFKLLV